MGGEKDPSRGGFFQLFDWTAKSRKKLFSGKSEISEHTKQGKKSHGSLPMTRFNLVDEDDFGAGSSIRGGSEYSCASSVTDEEGFGSRPPGVVARLMGLDSLPTSDPYSTPFFDTQSLSDVSYHRRNLDYLYDNQSAHSGTILNKLEGLARNSVEPKQPQKIISKPIEKFQTEMLPPKSAKSIPVTHHRLLSPIKSHGSIPAKNAAHIMEAASRIIEAGTHAPMKGKMPLVGPSSVPIKVRDLKEKVEASQRMHVPGASTSALKGRVEATQKPARPAEPSRRTVESSAAKYLKEQPLNKSWNGPSLDSEEASSKGKSISLAIQAKVNVQKREGLHTNGSRSFGGLKEDREVKSSTQAFKSQSSVQKNLHKKSSTQTASTVLRQNNQKQNSLPSKDKLPSKPSVSRKVQSGDPSCERTRAASKKSTGSSRTGSRKLGIGEMDNEKEVLYSGTKNHPRKKRSIGGEFSFQKTQVVHNKVVEKSRKPVQSDSVIDRHLSKVEDCRSKGMDVVSFTFTAPLTRPGSEATSIHQGKRTMLDSDVTKLSSLGYNVIGGDALSVLLEQKLKELSYGVECSRRDSLKLGSAPTTQTLDDARNQHALHTDKLSCEYDTEYSSTETMPQSNQNFQFQGADMMDERISNHMDARKFFDFRHPSPISVLETSFSTESCNYSDSVDSNSTDGSKPLSSSIQAQEVLGLRSLKKLHSADTELSDSASSTSRKVTSKPEAIIKKHLSRSNDTELGYVNDILHNIESMFKDFSLGQVQTIINPHLFEELESGDEDKLERKVMFDCVRECMDLRCVQYMGGGHKAWIKGMKTVKRKESLAEEVYKEILGWRGMGDCMVDELVDKDMSSQYGRWLDYEADAFQIGAEIELQIFNSLVEEVFADVL